MTSETDNKVEAAEPDAAHMLRLLVSVARGPSSGDRSYTIVIGQRDLDRMKSLASLDRTAPGETPKVCVLCGAPNANPRPWDPREPVCPDCQDGEKHAAAPAQEVAGLVTFPREPTREMWAALGNALVGYKQRHHDAVAKEVWAGLCALSSSPSQGGETVDRSGVAAADNNHKALAEGVLQVQSDLQMLARACQENDPKAEIAIRISDALDVIQDRIAPLLAAFTTKGMDQ